MPKLNPNWVVGPDVSQYQKDVDWSQVEKSGSIHFAIVRGGAGVTIQDKYFKQNYAALKSIGVPHGTYWFLYPKTSGAIEEAEAYVKTVEAAGGWDGWRPMADIEQEGAGNLGVDELTDWLHQHLERLEQLSGMVPAIYSNPSFLKTRIRATEFSKYPLWISHYDVDEPEIPSPWNSYVFWQYTSSGSIPGISGRVDMNVFAGTLDELHAFCNTSGLASRGGQPPTAIATKPKISNHRTLFAHATGADVKLCQRLLYRAGQHPGPIDGVYGSQTMDAVKAFQRAVKIATDGICGPDTWDKLEKAKQANRPLTVRGDQGQQVMDLQYLLQYHGANPGDVDSVFGPNTESAVRQFQKAHKLQVDGKVGPQTWGALLAV